MLNSKIHLAVLPFRNVNKDSELEYFNDGLTEEIISKLSITEGLMVCSRTSSFNFKDSKLSVVKIAELLKVDAILEGSIRFHGESLRLSINLIDTKQDVVIWSEIWDRNISDVFAIQSELSVSVVEKVRENYWHFDFLGIDNSEKKISIDAYQLFLKGKFLYRKWNKEDVFKAIENFEEAIAIENNFAESYVGLANCYTFLAGTGFMSSKEALLKANDYCLIAAKINPTFPELHFALASKYFWEDWNFKRAFKEINSLLEINPNHDEAHSVLGLWYALIGKSNLSEKHIKIALRLDPYSSNKFFIYSWILYLNKDYELAIEYSTKAIDYSPNLIPAIFIKACSQMLTGDVELVLNYFNGNNEIDKITRVGTLAIAYSILKNDIKVEELIKELKLLITYPQEERTIGFLFLINSVRNDQEKAINWLKQAFDNKIPLLPFLINDPLVERLDSHPEYRTLKERLLKIQGVEIQIKSKENNIPDKNWVNSTLCILNKYISEEEPYLEPSISLRDLANSIDIHPNNLSWLINNQFGKNFNEYINHFRVETFKKKVVDPKNTHFSLLGLSYECGFNSKTSFNTVFKKETGMTPKEYHKQISL